METPPFGLKFRSLCSGSSGNAALLWTPVSAVLLDFAPGSQRDCRAALEGARKLCPSLDTVLATHAHGDHINANSLKVLAAAGFKVRCHPEVAAQIKQRYGAEHAGILHPFVHSISVGDLRAEYAQVTHVPGCVTTGFVLTAGGGRKACLFTDLHVFGPEQLACAAGADLLVLEANHDVELLAKYGHPGSEFHLSNRKAAQFLHEVCSAGRQPQAVVLSHLSEQCNRPHLPPEEVLTYFSGKQLAVKFDLHVAARYEPGPILVIK